MVHNFENYVRISTYKIIAKSLSFRGANIKKW